MTEVHSLVEPHTATAAHSHPSFSFYFFLETRLALRWLLNFHQPEGQVARWIETLQQCHFDIEHQPGPSHSNADSLSRCPCLEDSCKHCDRLDSQEMTLSPGSDRNIQMAKVSTLNLISADKSKLQRKFGLLS